MVCVITSTKCHDSNKNNKNIQVSITAITNRNRDELALARGTFRSARHQIPRGVATRQLFPKTFTDYIEFLNSKLNYTFVYNYNFLI